MTIPSSQLASAALIGQIGGGAISTVGSYFSGASQRAALDAQATMADANARIAELGAQSARDQGERQIGALTMQAGQLRSRQRVAGAANGVDLGVGSIAEILASTEIMKDIDVGTATGNATRNAWAYRSQRLNFESEALGARAGAKAIRPGLAAAGTFLGSATNVAANWYTLNRVGALDGTAFARKAGK